MTDDLTIDLDQHVAVMEVRRPPHNFLDFDLLKGIADHAERLVAQEGCRAVVLCSEGKNFSAGANFGSDGVGQDPAKAPKPLYEQAARIFAIEVPVIAAVQGAAVGGGLGLACATDFRVATPSTRFHANFARLGFHQGFGLSVTLPRIVGEQVAQDLLFTGRKVHGEEALAIGLADRLAGEDELRDVAIAWARDIAASAPLAVRAIRETLRGDLVRSIPAVVDHEMAEQQRLWATEDSAAGIAASLDRTTPVFHAR